MTQPIVELRGVASDIRMRRPRHLEPLRSCQNVLSSIGQSSDTPRKRLQSERHTVTVVQSGPEAPWPVPVTIAIDLMVPFYPSFRVSERL
jgi:hypothetical protein